MKHQVLIVGGGIGGLAAAWACARAGCGVRLLERATEFSEVGAGIQMGPNVTRILQAAGLQAGLDAVAAYPTELLVRDVNRGHSMACLPLGERARQRYGAPYATIARADLHGLLLAAVQKRGDVRLQTGACISGVAQSDAEVVFTTEQGEQASASLLVGADGLWSRVRQAMLADGTPRESGHLAYRAMLPQLELPQALRSQRITVWLGPGLHVVQYPVRAGAWLNVVVIVEGRVAGDVQGWDHAATQSQLLASLHGACVPLQELIQSIGHWRLWPLCDRSPMRGAWQQAKGRIALLGDAAHPMRPYLAQGAGMAIEDAAVLGALLGQSAVTAAGSVGDGVVGLLQRYAQIRWQRCARVQARSLRNGEIFHASGPLRWGRDAAMRLLGERLLDLPWLYRSGSGII